MHLLKLSNLLLNLKPLIQWLLLASSFFSAILLAEEEHHYFKSSFNSSCGNFRIPYPFGLEKNCSMKGFEIICDTSRNPARAFLSALGPKYEVVHISINQNQVYIKNSLNVNLVHMKELNGGATEPEGYSINLTNTAFALSDKNKFTVTGCNSMGQIVLRSEAIIFSCAPACSRVPIDNNTYGLCQTPTSHGTKTVFVSMQHYYSNESDVKEVYNLRTISPRYRCGSAFLTEQDKFSYKESDLNDCLSPQVSNSVMVLDWVVNNNQTCKDFQRNPALYACKNNSKCEDYTTEDGHGYRCRCEQGYQGNPYNHHGCQDIDECTQNHRCKDNEECVNTAGSYRCKRLHNNTLVLSVVLSFVSFSILLLFVSFVYYFLKRRRLIKLREKFFRENGGMLLQQNPFRQSAGETTRIFTANELLKATDHYSESRIIGRGGNGIVYKGFIGDNNQIVAIKKSRIEAKSQIEQFINEVVIVSQINHRNVVKLLGCCLETEVPLLVYEFVSNGSLDKRLHNPQMAGSISWNIRLRIAIETASALTYLHSAASVPIIHRDVKSANILLDENFVAKVSDFGASKFIPIDETQITTLVQGTFGYLDPEYLQTSQLTQKSDVYSYGVVLLEILTGESPVSFARPESQRNLSSYFILSVQQGRLFEILEPGLANEENKEELKVVADLAMRCLRLKGKERPLMKEVLIELIELRKPEKHPWGEANCEEALSLLNQQTESYLTQNPSTSIYSGGMPTDLALSLGCPR